MVCGLPQGCKQGESHDRQVKKSRYFIDRKSALGFKKKLGKFKNRK